MARSGAAVATGDGVTGDTAVPCAAGETATTGFSITVACVVAFSRIVVTTVSAGWPAPAAGASVAAAGSIALTITGLDAWGAACLADIETLTSDTGSIFGAALRFD